MSDWALIEHLTDYLSRPRLGHEKQPTLWPSEASAVITNKYGEKEVVGKCRRATFFRYAISNYEFDPKFGHLKPLIQELQTHALPIEPYLRWIWTAGELYEEYVVSLAKSSGVYIDSQIRIYIKEYNISGLADLIVINPDNYKRSVVEVKSVYGHGGNYVLGSQYERRTGKLGTPRDSNLMQIALYDWYFAHGRDDFEESRLVYGSRDTGRYAEYRIRTAEKPDGTIGIYYQGLAPNRTHEIESPITINSIVEEGYRYVSDHLLAGTVPPRDFELRYSEEKILDLYEKDKDSLLTKAERTQVEKRAARDEENKQRVSEGKAPKKQLKPVEKGDFQCSLCKFRNVCWNEDTTPRDI